MAAATARRRRGLDDEAGLVVDDRLGHAAGVAGDRGMPAAAASSNTIPKPSCSRPAHRDRQHSANTSAHPYSARQVGEGTRPSSRTGAPLADGWFEPQAVPPGRRWPPSARGAGRPRQAGGRPDQGVHPFARHQPAHADHQRARRRAGRDGPGCSPARWRPAGGTGSDPRLAGSGRPGAGCRLTRVGPPSRGTRPRRSSSEAPPAPGPARRAAPGSRPGTVDLGAVEDHRIRQAQARADKPERDGRDRGPPPSAPTQPGDGPGDQAGRAAGPVRGTAPSGKADAGRRGRRPHAGW